MHEKIYKAFHQDISLDNYNELDELKEKFESMKPFNEYEKDGLKSYDDAFLVRFTYESNAYRREYVVIRRYGACIGRRIYSK